MSALFSLSPRKQHDTADPLECVLMDGDGLLFAASGGLNGAAVTITMTNMRDGTVKVFAPCVIVDPDACRIRYQWLSVDVDTLGKFKIEFKVTRGGHELRVPSNGWFEQEFLKALSDETTPPTDGNPNPGPGADGVDAFTQLTAAFTQPAVSDRVVADVRDSSWMVIGQVVFVEGGGYYRVFALPDSLSASLTNLFDSTINTAGGATVPSLGGVSPGGERGPQGAQGIQGIQGIQGDKGNQGDIGPIGPSGMVFFADVPAIEGAPIAGLPDQFQAVVHGLSGFELNLSGLDGAGNALAVDHVDYMVLATPDPNAKWMRVL